MPRFNPDPSRPEDLVASIVALSEQTTRLALSSAQGESVEAACRLAVSAGVATGEVAWLTDALGAAGPGPAQLQQAAVAVASLQGALLSVAFAIQELGGPVEIRSAADALGRAGLQLEDVLAQLQREPALPGS